MQNDLKINVATLDAPHLRALEEVIGRALATSQQLVISIVDIETPPQVLSSKPSQSIDDWTGVYDGLSDQQIEAIDTVAKSRANLTRNFP